MTLPVYVTRELMLTMDFRESAGARMSNVTWRIEPETILVSGPAEVLNNMDSIVLDEFDLASLGSTTNYSYAIPIPEGCENLSGVTRATLRISFNDLQRSRLRRLRRVGVRQGGEPHRRPARAEGGGGEQHQEDAADRGVSVSDPGGAVPGGVCHHVPADGQRGGAVRGGCGRIRGGHRLCHLL